MSHEMSYDMAAKTHRNHTDDPDEHDPVTRCLLGDHTRSSLQMTVTKNGISELVVPEHGIKLKEFKKMYSNTLDTSSVGRFQAIKDQDYARHETRDTDSRDTDPRDTDPRDTDPRDTSSRETLEVRIYNDSLSAGVDLPLDRGPYGRCMEKIEDKVGRMLANTKPWIQTGFRIVLLLLYTGYFAYCMYYRFGDEGSILLLFGTALFVLFSSRRLLLSAGFSFRISKRVAGLVSSARGRKLRIVIQYFLYLVATGALAAFIGLEVLHDNPSNCQSFLGVFVLILICLIFSKKPSRINWHPVFWGFMLQFAFAIFTLRTQFGYRGFHWVGKNIKKLMDFSDAGSEFVFGPKFKEMGFSLMIMGAIIFFNCLICLLTHWGVMDLVTIKLGTLLGLCLDTGPVESVNAVANIFLSFNEVGLLIRPYLSILSRSELCAVMTGGFASVAGGILAVFINFGAPANHLLTASIISAPAALALTKVIYPETETVNLALQTNLKLTDRTDKSRTSLSVFAGGAVMAAKIGFSVIASMLAFVCLLRLTNSLVGWFGERAGVQGLSFEMICSFLLYPLSYVMGVVPEDCGLVASLVGIKLFATPFVGYQELGKIIKNRHQLEEYVKGTNGSWHWSGEDVILDAVNTTLIKGVMQEKSEVITTYAMCGFSAVPAIGICIGSLTSMCPARKEEILQIVMTAFLAGNLASFATGAVAGILYTDHKE